MNKGFTLIELLVVIAIIAILSGIILFSLNTAKVNAKDAVRKSDLNSIKSALELYANDHNGKYPSTIPSGQTTPLVLGLNGCSTWSDNQITTASSTWIPGLVSGGYIPKLPHDPDGLAATLSDPVAAANAGCNSTYLYSSDGTDYAISNSLAVISTNPANTAVMVPVTPNGSGTSTGGDGTGGTGGGGSGGGGYTGNGNSGRGISYALQLNGTSNYLQTPNVYGGLSQFSYVAWVKLNNSNALSNSPWLLGPINSYRQGMEVNLTATGQISTGYTGISGKQSTITIPIDSSWHFIAVTTTNAAGGQTCFYVDAGAGDCAPYAYTPDSSQYDEIGYATWGGLGYMPSPYANISITQISKWNKALSPDELAAIYTSGISGNSANLLAYYDFHEGYGKTVSDVSGNNRTGTIIDDSGSNWPAWSGNVTGSVPPTLSSLSSQIKSDLNSMRTAGQNYFAAHASYAPSLIGNVTDTDGIRSCNDSTVAGSLFADSTMTNLISDIMSKGVAIDCAIRKGTTGGKSWTVAAVLPTDTSTSHDVYCVDYTGYFGRLAAANYSSGDRSFSAGDIYNKLTMTNDHNSSNTVIAPHTYGDGGYGNNAVPLQCN